MKLLSHCCHRWTTGAYHWRHGVEYPQPPRRALQKCISWATLTTLRPLEPPTDNGGRTSLHAICEQLPLCGMAKATQQGNILRLSLGATLRTCQKCGGISKKQGLKTAGTPNTWEEYRSNRFSLSGVVLKGNTNAPQAIKIGATAPHFFCRSAGFCCKIPQPR